MDSGRGLSCRICRWPMKKVIVTKVWRSQCRAPGAGPEGARAGRGPPARPGRAAVSQPRAGGSITLHCCHEADGKYRAPGFFHTQCPPLLLISCHDDHAAAAANSFFDGRRSYFAHQSPSKHPRPWTARPKRAPQATHTRYYHRCVAASRCCAAAARPKTSARRGAWVCTQSRAASSLIF